MNYVGLCSPRCPLQSNRDAVLWEQPQTVHQCSYLCSNKILFTKMSIGISLPTSSLPLFPGFPLDCLRIQKPSFLFPVPSLLLALYLKTPPTPGALGYVIGARHSCWCRGWKHQWTQYSKQHSREVRPTLPNWFLLTFIVLMVGLSLPGNRVP